MLARVLVVFWVRNYVLKKYVLGTRVRNQRVAVFRVDCTGETVCRQFDFYGTASRYVLILIRIDGAFV